MKKVLTGKIGRLPKAIQEQVPPPARRRLANQSGRRTMPACPALNPA